MVLHTFDMNMQSLADKKVTICLLLFLLELFLDGELSMLSYFVCKKIVSYIYVVRTCSKCVVAIGNDSNGFKYELYLM